MWTYHRIETFLLRRQNMHGLANKEQEQKPCTRECVICLLCIGKILSFPYALLLYESTLGMGTYTYGHCMVSWWAS